MIRLDERILKLREWISKSNNIVFFGGAGVSTESGIPDFRSENGIYNKEWKYPPETIMTHSFFQSNPEEFYRFSYERGIDFNVEPNRAHIKLAELEQEGKLKAVITQNVDGLHQKAGSKTVLELHGSLHRAYCSKCRKAYPPSVTRGTPEVPRCECGGVIRADVVLFEEPLDTKLIASSIDYIKKADMLIVGGTSLGVYPAAGLIRYYRGNKLVLINFAPTPYDSSANLIINGKIGEVFAQI